MGNSKTEFFSGKSAEVADTVFSNSDTSVVPNFENDDQKERVMAVEPLRSVGQITLICIERVREPWCPQLGWAVEN